MISYTPMFRSMSILCVLGSLSSGILSAQTTATVSLPDATVGIPYSVNFFDQASLVDHVASTGFAAGYYDYSLAFGSTFPAGLTADFSAISGTPSLAGKFNFTVTFSFFFTAGGIPNSEEETILFSLNVAANPGATVVVNPGSLTFSFQQGAVSPATRSIVISNRANAAQNFTASATVSSGSNWLSVSPGTGTIQPVATGTVTVTVDPSKLGADTYLGTVSIALSPDNVIDVSVTAAVSSGPAQLQLSQTGLRFQSIVGSPANPPAQSITVLSSGPDLNVSTAASTLSGGKWLSAAPSSTTATSAVPATVAVNIQSLGLQPPLTAGDYYGQVNISSDSAVNSPQSAVVVLNVAPAAADLGAIVSPTGVIFVGQAGTQPPGSKNVVVTSTSPTTPGTFIAELSFGGESDAWFTVTPTSAKVDAADSPTITVQPIAGLRAGIYRGEIQLLFPDDGPVGSSVYIDVLAVITPAAASRSGQTVSAAASTCAPTKLLPLFTQLGANFETVAAWPAPIEVTIVDDCGSLMTTGSVTASFSNSDPSLPLTSLNDGRWSATWQPSGASAQVVITVDASEAAPAIQGTASIGGYLAANPTTPSVNDGGIVSAAKYAKNQPLAPGSFTSIYGLNLGTGQNPALSLPLPNQLGSTQVVLGGRALPLQFTTGGQVNAVIPYDMPLNTIQQLIVTSGPELSMPQSVVIATAQPASFAQPDGSGIVFDAKPGQTAQALVDAAHPMSAGDAIVIYCAGLGAVDPSSTAGSAAPSSPPAQTTNAATVTIGGKSAQVFFSGLVSGFAGLYQVNAYVPKGITAGDTVPLVISVAGFESAPVTVAVK